MEEIFENMGEDYEKFVKGYEEFIEKLENKTILKLLTQNICLINMKGEK